MIFLMDFLNQIFKCSTSTHSYHLAMDVQYDRPTDNNAESSNSSIEYKVIVAKSQTDRIETNRKKHTKSKKETNKNSRNQRKTFILVYKHN